MHAGHVVSWLITLLLLPKVDMVRGNHGRHDRSGRRRHQTVFRFRWDKCLRKRDSSGGCVKVSTDNGQSRQLTEMSAVQELEERLSERNGVNEASW